MNPKLNVTIPGMQPHPELPQWKWVHFTRSVGQTMQGRRAIEPLAPYTGWDGSKAVPILL